MSQQPFSRPPTRRPPLGEATRRVNNSQQLQVTTAPKGSPIPHHESLRQDGLLQVYNPQAASPRSQGDHFPLRELQLQSAASPNSNVANPRLSAISKDDPGTDSNRNSQISTVSTNASDGKRIKSYIGPWKLGKTLGKGATARVRLARHKYTGQEAAIKIVQKKNAQMSQAGSLADLDKAEASMADSGDGIRRMPVGIEREVAIMKLIQHPNIMKLYDIWENRTEIYLVLEYVDNGELFEHITNNVRLEEEEAMKYFRQILSAVGYCHSFNICHRDLKPENILLTKEGDIKIADFGMAALHQGPDHKLKTSCGSPHYAAPELIRGSTYRGDKVDIWSMGVVLYATLSGRLPFDVETGVGKDWLTSLLTKIRKGSYEMAPEFSVDAADLIQRILQVNPRDRINLNQIWRHPAVRKYDYLDDFGGGINPQSPSIKDCGRPVLRRSDINKELLRHLRSMWHRLSEQELMEALLCEEPNDQKLFYSLLLKYRDAQLENYTPDIGYSTSDYHHVRPLTLSKAYSTCHFPQPKLKGHGRQMSRFTVISNVAETERSYDPFKASRPQHLDAIRHPDQAKVTIHRAKPSAHEAGEVPPMPKLAATRGKKSDRTGGDRGRQPRFLPPKPFVSRSSLASSTRSRSSAGYPRVSAGYKRGVSFNHLRNRSTSGQRNSLLESPARLIVDRHSNNTEVTVDGDILRPLSGNPSSTRYIRSRKAQSLTSQAFLSVPKAKRITPPWSEDVRQLSTSLAKDCDEAFNRSSVASAVESSVSRRSSTPLSSLDQSGPSRQPSLLIPPQSQVVTLTKKAKHTSLDSRPLPPPPARSESIKMELIEARKQAELRKVSGGDESPGYLDRMVSHIDRLIQPSSPIVPRFDRRALSAPADSKQLTSARPLPSINEARGEESSPSKPSDYDQFMDRQRRSDAKASRIASAPEPHDSRKLHLDDRFSRPHTHLRDTIRVINPSTASFSPVRPPAPLTIRKKSSQGGPSLMSGAVNTDSIGHSTKHRPSKPELRQQYHNGSADVAPAPDLTRIDEDRMDEQLVNDSSGTILRKKSSWFRRSSKSGEDIIMSIGGGPASAPQSSTIDIVLPKIDIPPHIIPKKKGFSFGRLFKKRNPNTDMMVSVHDIFDDNASMSDSIIEGLPGKSGKGNDIEAATTRQIEPQRNWLAKLFNVRPASKFICFSVSKRRARKEVTNILKEWKRYGIRDVQVDKIRNIVFGKVAAKNFLDMKEVAFAGEIMTVIEHGKRSYLSIARFTQERGAASSFHKVVETLETVLKCRGLLVADERKKRMMIKTLNTSY
ncbi:hypothetical protein B7494_g3480 [Chlorociboria aeruginascens]|nr:hypothetical protein B7494_g3480 [Chlorociboria aeruginascens]